MTRIRILGLGACAVVLLLLLLLVTASEMSHPSWGRHSPAADDPSGSAGRQGRVVLRGRVDPAPHGLGGESVTLDLPARRASFLVTVRTERGIPVEQARVRLRGEDEAGESFLLEGMTEKNGACALLLPARPRGRCSLYADHSDLGSAVAYPEELGEGTTLYLELGQTVSLRVVDDEMRPLAAEISYCMYAGGHLMRRGKTEILQSVLHVAAVPRRATLCVWAVTPDGRFDIETAQAQQEIVLVLGPTAEVACRIESPLTLRGDGGIWLVPPEARGAWEAIAVWGGAELRDRLLIPLSAQSNPVVLTLPTGPRPARTYRARFDLPWVLGNPDLRLEAADRFVRVSRHGRTEAVLNLFLVQETSVAGVVRAARDGRPLEGVLVGSGYFDADVLARTDASGRYRVTRKRVSPFRLIFRAPGYRTFASERIELTPGRPVELEVTLGREGAVLGRVLAVDGQSLAGVHVSLLAPDGAVLADTRSDGRGWFHLEGAPDGPVSIRADLGEHATPWEDAIEIAVEVPVVRDFNTMPIVELRASPGSETATVSGGVRGLPPFGRAGARFALVLRGRGERANVAIHATIRNRRFLFERVPFGEYEICYVVSHGGSSIERTMTPLSVRGHPMKFSVGVPAIGFLLGQVSDEQGAPIGDVPVSVVDARTGMTASSGYTTHTDETGAFLLDLMAGRYFIELRSAEFEGCSDEVVIRRGAMDGCLITARRGGSMRLQIQAAAEDRVEVTLTLEGPTARRERGLVVPVLDGVGILPVHGLEPGVYTVHAVLGARTHVVESVEVVRGATTPVSLGD